jgi:hypothetical protein
MQKGKDAAAALKKAMDESIAAANAVKTATASRNFGAIADAKKKVEAAAAAVNKAKEEASAAAEAMIAAGMEAEALAMGLNIGGGDKDKSGKKGKKGAGEKPKKRGVWLGITFEAIGAGAIAYGVLVEERNVNNLINHGTYPEDYDNAKRHAKRRDTAYIIGAAALLSGLSIHIFF